MSSAEIGPSATDRADRTGPIGLTKRGASEVAAIPSPRSARRPSAAVYATGPVAVSDAALAAAAATNATAFAAIYRRYGDALHGFCLGMLRDPDAAADCVHDVFVTAATRLGQLREHDKLRPWLYAVARHEALRRLRARRRERSVDEVPDAPDPGDGPEHGVARRELAELVAAASGGLSDRERAVFELHYRQGLDGPALADALGVSATNANTLVGRLRATVERSLGALLVARHEADRCPGLAEVLDGWDGTLTVLMRKRIARHTDHCPRCARARADLVDPRALLASAPVAVPAPDWLEGHVLADAAPLVEAAAAGPAGAAGTVGAASWWPAGLGAGTQTVVAVVAPLAAAAVAVPVVLIGVLSGPAAPTGPGAALAGAPAGVVTAAPTTPSAPRFALDPSTTRYAPTATSTGARPTVARPEPPRAGAGPAPRTLGSAPTSGPARRNAIGIPVIPRTTEKPEVDVDPRPTEPTQTPPPPMQTRPPTPSEPTPPPFPGPVPR